jgi:hypothetical protein
MGKFGAALGALALIATMLPAAAQPTSERERPKRPRIVIHPQRWTVEPGPNAKRYCRSWLVQEYRESGTVIVPKMQCWWD